MASSLKKRNNRSLLKICVLILERLLKNNSSFILLLLLCYLLCQGLSDVAADEVSVSVKEGDSVTLQPDVKTNQQDRIRWYFSDTRIAQMNGNFRKICTDVQCNEGNERFRGRLKLDHQTGSLTITNTRTTDSGLYRLQISSRNNENIEEIFSVTVQSYFSASTDGVSVFVMERDSVTFQTGVETNQQDRIRWYFSDVRIAQISGNLSNICTDVQCNTGTERFRDRLKLNNQTGSLTIMNITNTDSGLYELIISSKNYVEKDKTFKFALHGEFKNVSAAEQYEMKKEGENLTLSTGVINTNDEMRWYFNDTRIAEITGDQSKICADDQCKERFRDRLKLDHQTGSLIITNTTTTDSGDYKLQIHSSRFSISRKFTVSVTVTDPGPPSSAAGTNAAIILSAVGGAVLLVAFVIYCRHKRCTKQNDTEGQNNPDEENGTAENLINEEINRTMNVGNGSTTDKVVANETSVISSLHQHQ